MTSTAAPKSEPSNRPPTIALGTVVLVFGGLIGFMWAVGLFHFDGSDPDSKVVAAALALVGVALTAAVTIVGIILQHALHQRTARREEIEAARSAAEAREAEQ